MGIEQLVRICAKTGIEIFLVVFLCVLIYKFLMGILAKWDMLTQDMKVFMSKVRDEHHQSKEEHKALMEHHSEITKALGRINGYK